VWQWNHDPFGNGAPLGAFTYELRFPGQFFDQATYLHYNYFRDYDPRTGRYIESDPIGLAGGTNTYVYAGGNPVSRKNPQGMDYGISTPSPTLPASHSPPSDQQMCFAGTLIDKRYDEVGGITHCTYSTPFWTYTLEIQGFSSCPPTSPAPY
jgi:RHS repeat-associated protein